MRTAHNSSSAYYALDALLCAHAFVQHVDVLDISRKPRVSEPRLRAWRKHKSLTQERMAERLEVTQETVSRIERGLIPYNQETLEAWAYAVGCDVPDLFRDPDERPSELELLVKRLDQKDRERALKILQAALAA